MEMIKTDLSNLESVLPEDFTPEQTARAKTVFYQLLAEAAHRHYHGKIQIMPKVPLPGFNWFNVWYTPGVSRISTTIRDHPADSFELTNRSNLVAVVSDATRVLGDGDVTPAGGMGVMEGKALLMKYLAGIDAVPICLDSRNGGGEPDADVIVDFVKRLQPSFGAINLEDISQPNCYRVLDRLRAECEIPVWHDDAQGTASVVLAGLLNALKITDKKISDIRIVYLGAGASNTACARLINQCGADPGRAIMFDKDGALTRHRRDFANDPRYYQQWHLCQITNPAEITDIDEAIRGADVLISFSRPGPDIIKPSWVAAMSTKPIVFACANPVPEIYPDTAKHAGALIIATGRGDFPNQVNNSLGFPGILKGALIVQAKSITDNMAIAAARCLAGIAEETGLAPDRILPTMNEPEIFIREAVAVGEQAAKDGVAQRPRDASEIFRLVQQDINQVRRGFETLLKNGIVQEMDQAVIEKILKQTVAVIRGTSSFLKKQ